MSKEIVLRNLRLKNFKGIKDLTIDMSNITNIYGDNGTGKTSIFDAFTWLLFDKDSQDRTTFEIKTLDSNNCVLHGLDHEVTGVLNIDGKNVILTKTYKEKWTKKRGEAERELTGHETLYYIDEVPVKKSEFQEKIGSIIKEQLFKLISNPLYFSANMKWQDRRSVLLELIGDVSTVNVIAYNSSLRPLEVLLMDKDIDTLKKSIQARKRKLNDDIKSIPYRIDECNNSISQIDFETLEIHKSEVVSAIKNIEDKIMDASKLNEEVLTDKSTLSELKSSLRNIEFIAKEQAQRPLHEMKSKLYNLKNQAFQCNQNIASFESGIGSDESHIAMIENELQALREEYAKINEEILSIPEDRFTCPTCNRPLEEHDIETQKQSMQENFNLNKSKRLSNINAQGKAKKERVEKFKHNLQEAKSHLEDEKEVLASLDAEIAELNTRINQFDSSITLENNEEYQDTLKQIQELETKLKQSTVESNNLELKFRKLQLEHEIEDINRQLARKQHNENMKARITELMEEEKKLSKQIAELEGQEYLCEEFIKTKVELLEGSINSKFNYVKFKLFETQVNGGVNECCEALINGIPFSNANTASQINAGLDIINALCAHYGVGAPIFIDNRESINQIIECNSQIINLIVSKDRTLRVEHA